MKLIANMTTDELMERLMWFGPLSVETDDGGSFEVWSDSGPTGYKGQTVRAALVRLLVGLHGSERMQ